MPDPNNTTDHCDYCKKEFPQTALGWVSQTSVRTCIGCRPAAEKDYEEHCREIDAEMEDDY